MKELKCCCCFLGVADHVHGCGGAWPHINKKRGIVRIDGGVFSGRGTRRRFGHAGTATGFDIETNSTKPSSIESGIFAQLNTFSSQPDGSD